MTGPDLLLQALQFLAETVLVGLALLVVGWLLVRRGVTSARPVLVIAALWVGVVGGFYLIGILTCAFCLS